MNPDLYCEKIAILNEEKQATIMYTYQKRQNEDIETYVNELLLSEDFFLSFRIKYHN